MINLILTISSVISTLVLVIDRVWQEKPPPDTRTLFMEYPAYRENATQFVSIGSREVGPADLLYVKQRELAVSHPQDRSVKFMGSDDATSCIVVILRHSGSGAVGLAHLDGAGTEDAVNKMVGRVQKLSSEMRGEYELSLVGGVTDDISEKTFSSIMSAFHEQLIPIHLRLACVGEPNTLVKDGTNWPRVYGAVVILKTGVILPATFTDKGPDRELRSTRYFTGGQEVLDIYDGDLMLLKIGPFDYKPLNGIEEFLKMPDEVILAQMSTTPEVEPADFVAHTRATFKYILKNPFPAIFVFPDGRPHYYRRNKRTSLWVPFSP